MAYRTVLRQDTAANWTRNNPVLLSGEFGFESNTNRLKLGDGVTWGLLAYIAQHSHPQRYCRILMLTEQNTAFNFK